MAYRSAYLPSMQKMPGLTNQQVYQIQHYNEMKAVGRDLRVLFRARDAAHHAAQQAAYLVAHQQQQYKGTHSSSYDDCVTAVEGREVAGRQVGNGTFVEIVAKAPVYSQYFGSFYGY
ncbi:unnamed protein product, partial [Mesorhabditis belari]|uniref:Uncharacterized protein n=1 Tax=Mesorhabditis belari TaxID=2138241 RepID=A0AAF3EP52_9BILA